MGFDTIGDVDAAQNGTMKENSSTYLYITNHAT